MDPDDLQVDYQKYRDLFKIMLKNISLIKPIRTQFLQRISDEIESFNPQSTPLRRAEVCLLAVIEIHECIPGQLRDRNTPDNPYCALV